MSPHEVLAAWALKMADRIEQQSATTKSGGGSSGGATFPTSSRAVLAATSGAVRTRGEMGERP
jgi:hypothetical protein